jgi:hypothetical protein
LPAANTIAPKNPRLPEIGTRNVPLRKKLRVGVWGDDIFLPAEIWLVDLTSTWIQFGPREPSASRFCGTTGRILFLAIGGDDEKGDPCAHSGDVDAVVGGGLRADE